MNHQVQNLVLVNNEWVSRPVDVYQIMAQARISEQKTPAAPIRTTARVPEVGILSRTVLASPVFKYIRSANIRHKDLNDVVLIGEDSVQLKEIRDYGHLSHVAIKSDFGGRILAARVFGLPRQIPTNVGSLLPQQRTPTRARRSMTGDERHMLPPEVVVLTLTSRTLMFLWARDAPTGTVSFTQKTIKLPAGASRFDRLGTFLAVDPQCRAIAVAAHEERFILYKTMSMERWRQRLQAGIECSPIEDERIIAIEGRILHMEFLSSGTAHDDFHVVLLFVVIHQDKTKITCFDWDSREDLSKVTARTEKVVADLDDHNPALLIPLSRTSEFLLAFDTHIAVYKDILSGVPRRTAIEVPPQILPSLSPGESRYNPRWVEWTKAPRNQEFQKEVFYIAREDGRIMYVERGLGSSLEMFEAGDWPYPMDTAFTCLNVDNSAFSQSFPDVLIAGGIGNDGLVCKVGAWPAEYSYTLPYPSTNQLTFVESMANWTPMTDLLVVRHTNSRAPNEWDSPSIFVANGSSPHGEVSELRYGLRSLVDDSFSGVTGCTGLWVLDYGSHTVEIEGKAVRQHYVIFAITLPPESILIRIVRTQRESRGDFSGAWEDRVWDKAQLPTEDEPVEDGFMRDIETITACPWSDTFAIQITRNEARILQRPNLQHRDALVFHNPLLLAASRPWVPFIAIAFREAQQTFLEIVRILQDGQFDRSEGINTKYQLEHDPTCIELVDIDNNPHVFVSTFDSKIFLFRVDDHGSLSLVMEDTLDQTVRDGDRVLLENAVVLSAGQQRVLVCATRSGHLISSPLMITGQGMSRPNWTTVVMGTTSARITASATDTSSAFVACGSHFCQVRCSPSSRTGLEIDSIWFTTRSNPGYLQSPVTAIYQLPFIASSSAAGRNLGGFIFTVAGDELLFSQLDSDVRWTADDTPPLPHNNRQAVPRKLLSGAKPTNIVYLKAFRKMLVSTMEAKEGKAPPEGYRILQSTIRLLNMQDQKPLDDVEVKQENGNVPSNPLLVAEYVLKNGERVYSIIEWPFTDQRGKKYTLIIIGTGVPGPQGKETGRRLILSPGRNGTKLQFQKESTFDSPVYCTAVYSNNATINAIGRTLTFDVYDLEGGRLSKRASIDLPSAAIHITVRAPYIYVSTLQHSHLCFEIKQTTPEGRYRFQRIFTDSRERQCARHLVVDNVENQDTIVLITDKKSASVTGIHHPPERTFKNASDTVFEATLPHTVVRLEQGDIRPPWRRPTTSSQSSRGVIADDIIGACSDGTIYTFTILSQPARHLLRLLQNIIEAKQRRDPAYQDTILSPRGAIHELLQNNADGPQDGEIRARDMNPENHEVGIGAPRHKHVDGDLLHRWMEECGDLERLLKQDMAPDVERLFMELVEKMWGMDGMDEGTEKAEERVMRWLGELLMPLL